MFDLCWTSGNCYRQIKRYLNLTLIGRLIITGMLCSCYTIKSFYGNSQYQCLPLVIKPGLAFASTNAESKKSLSINAIVVSSERSALGEVVITGLHTVNEAVRFYDPVNG